MTRRCTTNRVVFFVTFCKHLLFLLVTACIAMAQYRPPPYQAAGVSYGNTYQPFMTRNLVQADVKNCTDLHCGMEECCVTTPRASICVQLTIVNAARNERMCARPKLCSDDFNCFEDSCCVHNSYVTADTTCPPQPDYYKYPPHSLPGQVVKPTTGICVLKPNIVNATCFLSITGKALCPCGQDGYTDLICVPLFAGANSGTCQLAP